MDADLDIVWRALSDGTRRGILDALRAGPRTTGELVERFPRLSRFGVMKHLDVLVEAGLVLVRRDGRKRINTLNAVPLRRVYERWVSRYENHWARGLLGLKEAVEMGQAATGSEKVTSTPFNVARVELEIEIDAPPAKVWEALVGEATGWWLRAFYAGGDKATSFVIEPHLGGFAYEQWGDETTGSRHAWYQVVAIDPGKMLRLSGAIAPSFGGPASTMLELTLEPRKDGTALRILDGAWGAVGEAMESSMGDGWRQMFTDGLKAFIETGSRNE